MLIKKKEERDKQLSIYTIWLVILLFLTWLVPNFMLNLMKADSPSVLFF
jgi:hypothetical protein